MMLATDRHERLTALTELTRLAHVEAQAAERGEHEVARLIAEKMRDVVSVLGFDPLAYRPERDAPGLIINKRTLAMLRAMPGSTAALAQAAGVPTNHVRAYLLAYVERGEVVTRREGKSTRWEVAA